MTSTRETLIDALQAEFDTLTACELADKLLTEFRVSADTKRTFYVRRGHTSFTLIKVRAA